MLANSIRILNFDDSVMRQRSLRAQYRAEIVDFEDIAPLARLWMNSKIRKAIQQRLINTRGDAVTFCGSGDFHHISGVLLERIEEPFSLIVFDFHPDWAALPPRWGCGSWLRQALINKNLRKCILLGVSSSDISGWWIQEGDFSLLKDSRLEIYPYAHKPTTVFLKRVPPNISLRLNPGLLSTKIYWSELLKQNLQEFFSQVLARLPSRKVYISLDKDCLRKEFALTNWEEGMFSLEELSGLLRAIKERFQIIGMDIVGDYSPVYLTGNIKNIASRLDHPRNNSAAGLPGDLITSVNESTNLNILKLLHV